MTKTDLVAALAAKTGLTKTDSEKAMAALADVIVEATTNGDSVRVPGLGVFKRKDRAARSARNPRTGETVQVAARSTLGFKRTQAL